MENQKLINRKFENICIKAVSGNIDEAEKIKLTSWLNDSMANRKFYDEIEALWQNTAPVPLTTGCSAEASWVEMEKKIENSRLTKAVIKKSRNNPFTSIIEMLKSSWMRPAFVAVCLALVAFGGWEIFIAESEDASLHKITTLNRQKTEITLSDGSVVTLNCGSSLTYDKNFGDNNRQVFLQGEAFFNIVHNGLPFTVVTGNARTTVLGTEFNVRARGETTRVVVKKGCVRVESENKNIQEVETVVLSDHQMSEVVGEAAPSLPSTIEVEPVLGWLQGQLVFVEAPLIEILAELERVYDVNILLKDSSLNKRTITATFEQTSFETVLSSICLALGVKYQFEQNEYSILE